jgi:hypothetical protein
MTVSQAPVAPRLHEDIVTGNCCSYGAFVGVNYVHSRGINEK